MELNGRQVHFKRTIWSTSAIMKLCPNGDLSRIAEVFSGDTADQMMAAASFIVIMSQGYEFFKEFEMRRVGQEYKQDPVTLEELMAIEDIETFYKAQEEAIAAFVGDAKVTVESEPPKSKKKGKNRGRKSSITKVGTSTSDTDLG